MIGIEFHGVSLNLSADDDALLAHVAELVEPCVCSPWASPNLDVYARWLEGTDQWPEADWASTDRLGKRLRLADGRAFMERTHRDRDLQLGFCRSGQTLRLDVVYRYRPTEEKQRDPHHRYRKYTYLLRYLVLFPAVWRLQGMRGWRLLNAAVVARGNEALLVCGPGGSGKTTTSLALAASPGLRPVSDNPVLSDGRNVYPTYQPFRLTDGTRELLAGSLDALVPVHLDSGRAGKSLFRPSDPTDARGLCASAVILPRFTREAYVRRVPVPQAAGVVAATNRMSLTMTDYSWYSAVLDLAWPREEAGPLTPVAEALAAETPVYELGIDPRAGIDVMVKMLLDEVWPRA